jgi:hypothetical protein
MKGAKNRSAAENMPPRPPPPHAQNPRRPTKAPELSDAVLLLIDQIAARCTGGRCDITIELEGVSIKRVTVNGAEFRKDETRCADASSEDIRALSREAGTIHITLRNTVALPDIKEPSPPCPDGPQATGSAPRNASGGRH